MIVRAVPANDEATFFPGLNQAIKKKQTRQERLLADMDVMLPRGRLLGLIGPHYTVTGPKGGRPKATC